MSPAAGLCAREVTDAIGAMSLPPKLQGTLLELILSQSESIDANPGTRTTGGDY